MLPGNLPGTPLSPVQCIVEGPRLDIRFFQEYFFIILCHLPMIGQREMSPSSKSVAPKTDIVLLLEYKIIKSPSSETAENWRLVCAFIFYDCIILVGPNLTGFPRNW